MAPQSQAWCLLLPQLVTGAHPWDLALLVVRVEELDLLWKRAQFNKSITESKAPFLWLRCQSLVAWWNFLVGTALVIPKQLPTCEHLCWWCHHKC